MSGHQLGETAGNPAAGHDLVPFGPSCPALATDDHDLREERNVTEEERSRTSRAKAAAARQALPRHRPGRDRGGADLRAEEEAREDRRQGCLKGRARALERTLIRIARIA